MNSSCLVISVSTHSHPKVAANTELNFLTKTKFQHTATRRWLQPFERNSYLSLAFQHTATRRWLLHSITIFHQSTLFQHTATRRWLRNESFKYIVGLYVSTHSHPKVAAAVFLHVHHQSLMFQHTATRRWLH